MKTSGFIACVNGVREEEGRAIIGPWATLRTTSRMPENYWLLFLLSTTLPVLRNCSLEKEDPLVEFEPLAVYRRFLGSKRDTLESLSFLGSDVLRVQYSP